MEGLSSAAPSASAPPEHGQPYSAGVPGIRRSSQISRVGTVLFAVGWVVVATAFFLVAAEYYDFLSASSIPNFAQTELYAALSSTLIGVGILLVAAGWTLDQRAIARGPFSGPGASSRTDLVGYVLFLLGLLLIAATNFYWAVFYFAEYYTVPLSYWNDTYPTLEVLSGVGILLGVFGWLVQHLNVLSRLEPGGT